MCIWPNEKILLWWWSQSRLMREEAEIKHIDFKGGNPPPWLESGALNVLPFNLQPGLAAFI